MNTIANNQHFAIAPPKADIQRSKFKKAFNHKTTFNFGDIIPVFHDEILPGDTFVADQAVLARMSTPIHPVLDNSFLDFYYFFCPARLLWTHWPEFMGENNEDAWTPSVEYSVPQVITAQGEPFAAGSIADYFGLPTQIDNPLSVSALPFRAYTLIYNEWFRSEALQDPAFCPLDDSDRTPEAEAFYNPSLWAHTGASKPFQACRFHDYYSSALPQPQRGPDVLIPFADAASVWGTGYPFAVTNWTSEGGSGLSTMVYDGSKFVQQIANNMNGLNAGAPLGFAPEALTAETYIGDNAPLEADLTGLAGTINQLRTAFQLQRLLEADARGGGRYTEQIRAHFSVTSPDYRLQRPEYIGGKRIRLNMQQVLQTSATDETSPQGNTAAYSLTGDSDKAFTYSATEHGYIIGVAVARTQRSYQQGIERSWSRKSRFDYYFPEFAHIGNQAILNKEIYAQGTEADDEAFGYQEAWAEYRYSYPRISGAFRSNVQDSLDVWHYADYYETQPILGDLWIRATKDNVDRTLAVSSERADQLIMDFVLHIDAVRPMPVYSVPGLSDHF